MPAALRNKLILARQLGRAYKKRRLSGVLFCMAPRVGLEPTTTRLYPCGAQDTPTGHENLFEDSSHILPIVTDTITNQHIE